MLYLIFFKTFVIETDAAGVGFSAVLMQESHLMVYLSKALAPRHQALSAYEKGVYGSGEGSREMEAILIGKAFHYKD